MKQLLIGIASVAIGLNTSLPVMAQTASSLHIAYPPVDHTTSASSIFFVGTADPQVEVSINGQTIERSQNGHFAPSLPLQLGENRFRIRTSTGEEIEINVTRVATQPQIPAGEVTFAPDSLFPGVDLARLPGELICFQAVAPPHSLVSVNIGDRTTPMQPQSQVQLPPNSAVLNADNLPDRGLEDSEANSQIQSQTVDYAGCMAVSQPQLLGTPQFQLIHQDKTITETTPAEIQILDPAQLQVVQVTEEAGIARTGPSTNYSRLTPLPRGTTAAVTGVEGEWLRLDYGGWIKQSETQPLPDAIPPRAQIRSVTSHQSGDATEIIFPLTVPVPVKVQQTDDTFTLSLYNTTAQTDTIRFDDNLYIQRLDWQQTTPDQIDYIFRLKGDRQWGYDLRYEDTTLILTLRHPPQIDPENPLAGRTILLDPGHGGDEGGAIGPTGYPEKAVNLTVSQLLKQELESRGATVYLTRETDTEVALGDRVAAINKAKPDVALSIHYNALPDGGDAENTQGIGMFWYHPQAHNLAVFMHNYLVEELDRPSYGVFWNNLALTRPHSAPTILLELGFMINPEEFEWIVDPGQQQELASAIANALAAWFSSEDGDSM